MRVLIFGDSIAQGYFDSQSGGWTNLVAVHYQREALKDLASDWIEVFNLGVSGDTAAGVLDRITSEVEARRVYELEECIVIAVGINDTILKDNRAVDEEYAFQKVYEELIESALELCPRVICVGLSAVNERLTDPWKYSSSGKQWKNNRINLFEDIIKQSAERKEVAFVPIHDTFIRSLAEAELLADGLHPNTAGHALIAREVLSAIEALR